MHLTILYGESVKWIKWHSYYSNMWTRNSATTIEEVDEQESDDKSDEECDEEDGIREAGLFDTPMKLKLGANRIHNKDVDLNDFPLLKKIVRRFIYGYAWS